MMKKIYLMFLAAAASISLMAENVHETLQYEFHPTNMQYMHKPGVFPDDIDETIFNIGEAGFFPDHSPAGTGLYLALATTTPGTFTEINEDPGVPVGRYNVGLPWNSNNTFIPYVLRNYSEIRHMIDDGTEVYRNTYTVNDGWVEITCEDEKYYLTGSLTGEAATYAGDVYPIEVTIPRTEINPEYEFFGYPEVEDGYTMEQPSLKGSYTAKSYQGKVFWDQYQLSFYTTPLDAYNYVDGEGAIMVVQLNTEHSATVEPESLAGDYVWETYLVNYHAPFTFSSGFCMETDLVFGQNVGSRISLYDKDGMPTHSSFANSGLVKIEYLGDLMYRIDAEFLNQFAQSSRCVWEGPLFDFIENHPEVSAISSVEADVVNAPRQYFDLSGKVVDGNLAPGIYIVRQGDRVTKEVVK